LQGKFHPEILMGSPEWERQTRRGGKTLKPFFSYKRQYLKAVGDTSKVTIND